MGRTLVIDGNNQIIKEKQYANQDIEILVLKEGVCELKTRAFEDNNIKKLFIPKSLTEFGYGAIYGRNIKELIIYNGFDNFEKINPCILDRFFSPDPSSNIKLLTVEELTIIDANYEYILKFVNKYIKEFEKGSIKKVIVVNPNLSIFERIEFRNIFREKNIKVEFIDEINLDKIFNIDNILDWQNHEEIKNLVYEICGIIKFADDEFQNLVINKLNFMFLEYYDNIKKINPKYESKSNLELTFENNCPRNLKNNFIISLEIILQNLKFKNNLLVFSKKINQYQLFISSNKNIDVNDKNFEKIKDIVEMSKMLDNPKYKDALVELLNMIQKMIAELIKDENVIELTLENEDVENIFENKLNDLFVKLSDLKNKVLPYLNLLSDLKGQTIDKLSTDLRKLETIFEDMIGKQSEELYYSYKKLKNKYIAILKDNISKIENGVEVISAYEIETNFRKDLQIILEQLQILLPTILENKNLYFQLDAASKLLNGERTNQNGSIIDLFTEINTLLNNNLVDCETENEIKNKLNQICIYWNKVLNMKDLNKIIQKFNNNTNLKSKKLIIEFMILRKLYEIKIDLEEYINKLCERDGYINGIEYNLINSSKKN